MDKQKGKQIPSLRALRRELQKKKNPKKAAILERFFKTGPGEYGEGDRFLGITVPESRKSARAYAGLPKKDITALLKSPFHEERLIALLILVERFESGSQKKKKGIFDFYLASTRYINNWDLVDLTAHKIVGEYLVGKHTRILQKLARSRILWEKRIAIIATFAFIKRNSFSEAFAVARTLLRDPENLIHKAIGWMLREVGKRSISSERSFLITHYDSLPRTTLRYAIERFPPKERRYWLTGRL